jgi:hypothetical protein
MNAIQRKILFYIFIIAFLVISPLMIFYASGYKLNWGSPFSSFFIQKTGMLIIASDPAEAEIFLNGKKIKNFSPDWKIFKGGETIKTPAKLKNLFPGSYDLRVERSGYWPWERRIKIYPGQITHVLDVRLFNSGQPNMILPSGDAKTRISPNGKKIALLPSGTILEIKNNNTEKFSSSSFFSAEWSPDSGKIIFGDEVIDLKSPEKNFSLQDILGNNFSRPKWGKSNEEIIYLLNNRLNRLNLADKAAQTVLTAEKIIDFSYKKNRLAAIISEGGDTKLKITYPDKENAGQELELPFFGDYSFIAPENKYWNIYDKKNSILYIIDPDSLQIKETAADAKYFSWFSDKLLFYANDFEISALDIATGNSRLLTRISSGPLTAVLATKTDNYLVYFTGQTAAILTWDKGEEKIQPTEILRLDEISSPLINPENEDIYFLGKSGEEQGLYKLGLR